MTKKDKDKKSCMPKAIGMACCKVEAVISVDDRGQTVLPKELRDKANICAGDKLAVLSMEKGEKTCCLTLIKVEEIEEMVKGMLGPLWKEIQ